MKQKNLILPLIITVVIFLIAGIIGGYYLGKNSMTEMQIRADDKSNSFSDWKVYENKKYNFSVKYPSDWKVSKNEGSGTEVTFQSVDSGGDLVPSYIGIIPLSNNDLVTQVVGAYGTTSNDEYKVVSVNNQRFVVFIYTSQYGASMEQSEKAVNISKPVFDQMIITIKPL